MHTFTSLCQVLLPVLAIVGGAALATVALYVPYLVLPRRVIIITVPLYERSLHQISGYESGAETQEAA